METNTSDEAAVNISMKGVAFTKASTVNLLPSGRTPIFGTINADLSHIAGNNKLHLSLIQFIPSFTFDKHIPNAY